MLWDVKAFGSLGKSQIQRVRQTAEIFPHLMAPSHNINQVEK